jgi:histone-lysine N-methyltransferase SUV39H
MPQSQSEFSVVIPSPTSTQKRLNALAERNAIKGTNEQIFPIDAEEQRVAQAAYPKSRAPIDRRSTPLSFKSETNKPLNLSPTTSKQHLADIRANLEKKLGQINGPPVTTAVESPKLLAKLANNFEFTNDYIDRPGVVRVQKEYNYGCTCIGGCATSSCGCLDQEKDSEARIVPYGVSSANPRLIVASREFLDRKAMIMECNSLCGCNGEGCWNYVVQKGRTVQLQIFDAGSRGFGKTYLGLFYFILYILTIIGLGLRSPDPIVTGQFIDRYLGEVITKDEADNRENLTEGSHNQSYLFSLDWYVDDDDSEEQMNVIDGRKFGSVTRFINHSCNPNCKIVPVQTTSHADNKVYTLAFFALRDIPALTELTFDYNPMFEESDDSDDSDNSPKDDMGRKKLDPEAVQCLCGEANCRGQLWPNQRKGQNTKP